MRKFFVLWLTIVVSLVSCSKMSKTENAFLPEIEQEMGIVSVEEALKTLEEFMSDTEMAITKSGEKRRILSIETYYSDQVVSKSIDSIPDAYLVNFENEGGFAILGANKSVAPIIVVIENGNTCWKDIFNPKDEPMSAFEINSPDPGIKPNKLISMCVNGALYGEKTTEATTKSNSYNLEILPLTSDLAFGQHVTFCHKSNRGFVTNGCASTALAIAVAYNNYPRLIVDGERIKYYNCNSYNGSGIHFKFSGRSLFLSLSDYYINSSSIPTPVTASQKIDLLTRIDANIINVHGYPSILNNGDFTRTRYKITSAIFYKLNKIIQSWGATAVMPGAVVSGLEDLEYINVTRKKTSSLTTSQINRIISMLENNKPVIMGGWSLSQLSDSHYWVVDGIRQNNSQTLIHCNWGWMGAGNGWVASDCINPSSTSKSSSNSGNAWNNILVYTYDKQTYTPSVSEYELYNNRIYYE